MKRTLLALLAAGFVLVGVQPANAAANSLQGVKAYTHEGPGSDVVTGSISMNQHDFWQWIEPHVYLTGGWDKVLIDRVRIFRDASILVTDTNVNVWDYEPVNGPFSYDPAYWTKAPCDIHSWWASALLKPYWNNGTVGTAFWANSNHVTLDICGPTP